MQVRCQLCEIVGICRLVLGFVAPVGYVRGIMSERLQKIMAARGLGSRRQCESLIEQGRVRLNDRIAVLGDKASVDDLIMVDGQCLQQTATHTDSRVLLYHKPAGQVCTRRDEQGRATVFGSLPVLAVGRWIAIGRLDINTSGLLLFTTDGQLANKLMHPSSEVERVYAVRILGQVKPDILRKLQHSVLLEDGPARFENVVEAGGEGANRWYHVSLREGRNREVRRLWESQGLQVSRLMRIAYGGIVLPRDLPAGRYRELDIAELMNLYTLVNMAVPEMSGV